MANRCRWCGKITAESGGYCHVCKTGGSNSQGAIALHEARGSPSTFSLFSLIYEYGDYLEEKS